MGIDKKVNTRFTAKDGITKRFGIMARASARFGKKAISAFRGVNRQASKFRGITSGFLKAQVIGKGFGLLTRGISSVTTGFIAFDKAALGATVRFKDIGPGADNFQAKLKEVEASARAAGAATEFTAAQSAEALDFLAKAGFTSVEAMGALGAMINLATASGEDFAQVADMSSDLLGAFGLNAKDTTQKITNLNRVNDVLVKTANSANVTIEDMFETMKVAGPIAKTLGIEIEEVAALTGIMGNAGIKATMAGTALKNSFLNLSTQSPKVVKMLRDIGVEVDDGTGNMRKFTDILGDVGAATKEFGSLKVAKVLDTLFGKRAIAGASGLIENIADVREFEKTLLNAGMTAKQTAEIMRTSIDAKLKALGSSATEAGFKILNAFRVDGKSGIDALTESIRSMDMEPFIESLKVVFGMLSGIAKFTFEFASGLGIVAAKISLIAEKVGASSAEPSNFFKGIRGSVAGFFGSGVDVDSGTDTPNSGEARAKAQASQSVSVGGTINVNGPAGTTAEADGPVGFNLQALGAN